MKVLLSRIHSWLIRSAGTRVGLVTLFIFALADASFFPVPVTTYFLAVVVLNREMAFRYVLFVILGTLTGALTGYLIGNLVWIKDNGDFTGLSTFIFNNIPGFTENLYYKIQILFTKWNIWILCAAVTTPIPYGIFSVFAGSLQINIFVFLITTLVCQSIKFYLLATVTLNIDTHVRKLTSFNLRASAILNSAFIAIATFFSNTFKS
jgi:membrane protein YqaA with SNARE-associated domain